MQVTAAMLAASYVVGLWAGSWMIHSAATAERLLREDVLAAAPANYPPGTRLFFVNMPFFALEVGPSLRLATGRPDLQVYPLTLAPQVFFPKSEVVVRQVDKHTLLLHATDQPFFHGQFGDKIQLGWFGARGSDLANRPFQIRPRPGRCRSAWKSSSPMTRVSRP